MADIGIKVDGDDSFVLGCDSYTLPSKLLPGEYVMGMNIINRGGLAQTRPGSVSLFDIPSGNLQGCTFFKSASGVSSLVFAVDGLIYFSNAPFTSYAQIAGLQFSPFSKYIAWASCIQSTYYSDTGEFKYLDIPKPILIMQDGATRAAYWDGAAAGHINPTPSPTDVTIPDHDGTPVGLWMSWSNNRLWVSRGSQVFASDIGNPLKFTETQYINEARSFYLTAPCTGIVETSDRLGIVCFTSDNGVLLQSSIQDRTLWLNTPNFQTTILPNIGCVAPRSLTQQYGLIWWFTSRGLINQNSALALNITSRLDVQDNEMFQSKYNLSHDLSGVCGTYLENFLFHAVPNGDKLNTRVHVLDQAPFENNANSWPSYWTGWRPVEFARGVISSNERVFCASYDYDGVNRMWELFQADKTDNGVPITSFVQTKQHFFGDRDYKRFRYAEIELAGVSGDTALMASVAGLRGAFQPILSKDIIATNGQIYSDSIYGFEEHEIIGSKMQTRIVRTTDGSNPSDCNSECVESEKRGLIDKGFSLLIAWSGIAGISAYRVFSQNDPQALQGICEDNETSERVLTPEGCGSLSKFSTGEPFTTYSATATFSRVNPATGLLVSKTYTQSSVINQEDANRKAAACAQWFVLSEIGELP